MSISRSLLSGKIVYYEDFISCDEANSLFLLLQNSVPWQQERIRMMGDWVLQPRLTAWYGDPFASYTYAGLENHPLHWLPELHHLRIRIETELGLPFNSVLLNLYRDGRDYMGWHSDNEKSLGTDPVIASISLGAVRRFSIRPNKTCEPMQRKTDLNNCRTDLHLESGSLLLMSKGFQGLYKHALPKALRIFEARINLTFRLIVNNT